MKEGEGTPIIVAVQGMGPDAEVTINKAGGQQSQAPNAFHLVDPEVALDILDILGRSMTNLDTCQKQETFEAFKLCFDYMLHYETVMLIKAMQLVEPNMFKILETVAGRLMYGITKGNNGKGYPTNNWRLIPREEHLNHAMNHMFAIIMGDTQDDHRSAVICRLHMALATKESRDFRYQEYVENVEPEVPVMDKIKNRYNEFRPESKESPAGILHYIFSATANPNTLATARKCVEKGMNLEETLKTCGLEIDNSKPGTITETKQ